MIISPEISVVIPFFNAEHTIAEAIDSARAQTVRAIEILVVDDGSSDASASKVRALQVVDPRLRLLSFANGGPSRARNRGTAAATAPLVAFLDSDDRWDAWHLAAHLRRLQARPALALSFSRARFVDAAGIPTGEVVRPKLSGLSPTDILGGNPCTTCSTMVLRKTAFEAIGGFCPGLDHAEDQDLLLRLMAHGAEIEGVPDVLVDYRTSQHGLSADLDRMLAGHERLLETARCLLPEITAGEAALGRARMLRYAARRTLRLGQSPALARERLRRALQASPRLLLAEPRATLLTLAATVLSSLRPVPAYS